MADLLRPARGGFLRPFGCGWFIKEYLRGNGPGGSPVIDPTIGAPQAEIFREYKIALLRATAMDRAIRTEERMARREKRYIDPDKITELANRYLSRMPYKAQAAVTTASSSTSQHCRDWGGWRLLVRKSPQNFRSITHWVHHVSIFA